MPIWMQIAVIAGMTLGPPVEGQLRNSMSTGEGGAMVFVQRPVSLTLIFVVLAVLVVPRLAKGWSARTKIA